MTRPPEIHVGRTFTFTAEEEGEIASLLRTAQRALWIRQDGYRHTTVDAITRVNRIIHGALNRSHGITPGIMAPPLPLVPPGLVD